MATSKEASGWTAPQLLSAIASALALLGVIVYAALISAYDEFYRAFGLSPDEVGLGYSQILYREAQVLGGAALILSLLAVGAIAAAPQGWVTKARLTGALRRRVVATALFCVVGLLGGGALWLNIAAHERAQEALDGKPVGPIELWGAPILSVRAETASIAWQRGTNREIPTSELLYLGGSGGSVVLVDSNTDKVVAIPSGDIVLTLIPPDLTPCTREPYCE